MEAEWAKLLGAFPDDPTLRRHADLAARLKAAAPAVSRVAARGGATLVHGDFKAANVFVPRVDDDDSGVGAVVLDWQWAGPGPAAHDLLYLIATSCSEEVVRDEAALVERYHAGLAAALGPRTAPSLDRLRRDLDACAVGLGGRM